MDEERTREPLSGFSFSGRKPADFDVLWDEDRRIAKASFSHEGVDFSFSHQSSTAEESKRGGAFSKLRSLFSRKKGRPELSGPSMRFALSIGGPGGEGRKGKGGGDADHGMESAYAFRFKFGGGEFSFDHGGDKRTDKALGHGSGHDLGKGGGDIELQPMKMPSGDGDPLSKGITTRKRSGAISGDEHRPKLGGDEGSGGSRFAMQVGFGKGKSAFSMSLQHGGGDKKGGPSSAFKIDFAQMAKGGKGGKGAQRAFAMSIGLGGGGKKGSGGMSMSMDFRAMAGQGAKGGGKTGGGHAFQMSFTFGGAGGLGGGGAKPPTGRERSKSAPTK